MSACVNARVCVYLLGCKCVFFVWMHTYHVISCKKTTTKTREIALVVTVRTCMNTDSSDCTHMYIFTHVYILLKYQPSLFSQSHHQKTKQNPS